MDKIKHLPRGVDLEIEDTYLRLDSDLGFLWDRSGYEDGFLSMFDLQDGQLLRRFRLGRSKVSGICRTGDLMVVGGGDGVLYGFSVGTTRETGRRDGSGEE